MLQVSIDKPRTGARHYTIQHEGRTLSYAEVLDRWRHDEAFLTHYCAILADAPFTAYRWETPPVSAENLDRPFEWVLIDSPFLDCAPDPRPFAEHFTTAADKDVIVFPNLGLDATLVVPTPSGPASCYTHLAAFLRSAPDAQKRALWRSVAESLQERLSQQPLWLSTAGGGVDWLHMRLDSWPKYYAHAAYRCN